MLRLVALTIAVSLTVGCGGPANVNVPGFKGDIAINDPNAEAVKRAEVAAVRYTLERRPITGGFTLQLPEGTLDETYTEVLPAIGAGAVKDPSPELPTVEVRAIRLRGSTGQVDLVRPDAVGRRLHVVDLTYEFGHGWAGVSSRPYAIDPDTMPEPLVEPPSTQPASPPARRPDEPGVGDGRELFEPDTPVR